MQQLFKNITFSRPSRHHIIFIYVLPQWTNFRTFYSSTYTSLNYPFFSDQFRPHANIPFTSYTLNGRQIINSNRSISQKNKNQTRLKSLHSKIPTLHEIARINISTRYYKLSSTCTNLPLAQSKGHFKETLSNFPPQCLRHM